MSARPDVPAWRRDIVVLLASQSASAFGTALASYGITWYLTLETASGAIVALSIVFGMLPQAMISAAGGVLVDRVPRGRLIVLSQLFVAIPGAALAAALATGFHESWLIFLVLAIRSIGAGIRAPAVAAVIPQMVLGDQLIRVNGTFQTVQSGISILSPVAAAAALAATSITVLLLIDVAMAVVAMALMAVVSLPLPLVRGGPARLWSDLTEGVSYLRGSHFVRWVFTMSMVVVLLGAAPAYLVPLHIARAFGGDVWMLGGSQIAVSLGMIAAGVIAALLGRRLNLTALLLASPVVFAGALLALALTQSIWVLFVAMFFAGAALTVANGLSLTLVQERVQPAFLGRILGIFGVVLFAMPAGLIVFGPMVDVVPVQDLFLGAGLTMIIAAAFVVLRPAGLAAAKEGLMRSRPSIAPAGTVG